MNHRTIVLFSVVVALCLCSFGGRADMLSPKQIAEDDRLSKVVNIASPRIYVHDLLKTAAEQTGVNVASDDSDGASDQQIAVRLKEMKLSEVMNGLWSLFAYKGGLWHWERKGEPGNYNYTLRLPANARTLAGRLTNLAQEMFEEHMESLIRFVDMSKVERKQHKKELATALSISDDKLLDAYSNDSRFWSALKIFTEFVPREDRIKMYRGELTKKAAVASLSEQSRQFVRSEWQIAGGFTKDDNGKEIPIPEPTEVSAHSSTFPHQVGATLVVRIGFASNDSICGTGIDLDLKERLRKMWLQDGDSFDSPHLEEVIPASVAQQSLASKRIVCGRLNQVSAVMPFSFMARLPREQYDPGLKGGLPVEALLTAIRERSTSAYSKWRNDLLLVDYPRWYLDDPGVVPWRISNSVRSVVQRDGMIGKSDLVAYGGRLTRMQADTLSEDFEIFSYVRTFHEIFRVAGMAPASGAALLSTRGITLTDEDRAYFKNDFMLNSLFRNDSLEAIRLAQVDTVKDGKQSRELVFEVKDHDGKWRMTMGTMQFAPINR